MTMNFNIGEIRKNSSYLFADLAELILMTGYNGRESLHKNDLEAVINTGEICPEEVDEDEEVEATYNELNISRAERHNRLEQQLEDVLTQLDYRSKALSPSYPFQVNKESIKLNKILTEEQRVYRFVLACSRLRSFEGAGISQLWAKYFTNLSKIAIRALLPNEAVIRIFDANSEDRANYYTHSLDEALKRLGKDLAVDVNHVNCDKAGVAGDAGLDIVGFVNFNDGAKTSYALLGQCGAQETGWPKKTLEAHSMRYRCYYHLLFEWPGVMFTPVCYRDASGDWLDPQAATGIILIDRVRLMKLLATQNAWAEIIHTDWFIDFEATLSTVKAPD